MLRRTFLKDGLKTAGTVSALLAAAPGALAQSFAAAEAGGAAPLKEFSYGDVQLAPSRLKSQFEETQSILLGLDDDGLLQPWRARAGMPTPGKWLGGWYDEVPLVKTRSGGHGFAPGHSFGQWVSALARGYAANGDPATKAKLQRLIDLYEPTISPKFYTNFRFPAYNYDKMIIGLSDAQQFAGISNAHALLDRTTDAAEPHIPHTAIDREEAQRKWRASVGDNTTDDYTWDEPYTLAENLYIAAQRGAGDRYRKMAPRYLLDETYFDPLAENKNVLPGHHAYSFCNALSSAMQAYLCDGSEKHLRAAGNAFEMLASTQSYATGGWGPSESFHTPNAGELYASLSNTNASFETPCGSYAHFKLTRYLLRVTRDGKYGDSMERVLYNTVLGAKSLQPDGHAFYYSDYSTEGHKFYHNDPWPCCSGSLPQVTADYHILGYFHDSEGVYVNLYIPSTLKWTADNGAHLTLTQSGDYPLDGRMLLVMRASKSTNMALRLRIPAWTQDNAPIVTANFAQPLVLVNGLPVTAPITKGFATIRRKWKDGDRVELNLPMRMRLEPIDSLHPETVALVRGPLVLFALSENGPKVSRDQLLAATQTKGQPIWKATTGEGPLLLTPFTEIHEERYRTYMTVT